MIRSGQSVTVFANYTDVIVMMLHFWNNEMENIWICSEFTRNGRKHLKQLSDVVVHNLLFLHAFGGCDTTSAVSTSMKCCHPSSTCSEVETSTIYFQSLCITKYLTRPSWNCWHSNVFATSITVHKLHETGCLFLENLTIQTATYRESSMVP